MRNKNIAVTTTQKSPRERLEGFPNKWEKICHDGPWDENVQVMASIIKSYDQIYYGIYPLFIIQSVNGRGEWERNREAEALFVHGYEEFNYRMEMIVKQCMDTLIFHGKAYLEIALELDKDNHISGIQLLPLVAQCMEKNSKEHRFCSITWNHDEKHFTIENQCLVVFDLQGLQLKRTLFTDVFDRVLKADKVLGKETLAKIANPPPWYNFNEHLRKRVLQIMKATKDVYYTDYPVLETQLASDFFILYRSCHREDLKYRMMEYIVNQINYKLKPLTEKHNLHGQLVFSAPAIDYIKEYQKLCEGEISIKQLNDLLVGK